MKKRLFMLALFFSFAACAGTDDRYFYWNIADSEAEFAYARLVWIDSAGESGPLTVGDEDFEGVMATFGGRITESVFSKIGMADWSDRTFMVEAYDDDGILVGDASLGDLDDLGGFLYDYAGMKDLGGNGLVSYGAKVVAVPEALAGPALLCLVLLALGKRRTIPAFGLR